MFLATRAKRASCDVWTGGIVVDVSAIPDVKQQDTAIIFGRQTSHWGQATLPAEKVAAWAETMNYEVTTSFLPRVPRVYLRSGQAVAIHRLGGWECHGMTNLPTEPLRLGQGTLDESRDE